MLRVQSESSTTVKLTSMAAEQLSETQHLEEWIVAHPEVLGSDLLVITTQFNEWEAAGTVAHERPDILALSSSGQLVVVELKRGHDRKVHLQVITYGALSSSFTLESLSRVHAQWLSKRPGSATAGVSELEARQRLIDHVDDDWRDELLQVPKLVIVAEAYPAQVLTTVEWLTQIAPNLTIECHEYNLFTDASSTYAVFNRIYPVDDLSDRMLRAAPRASAEAAEELVERKRRASSVSIIHEKRLIPVGSRIALSAAGAVRPDVVAALEKWLDMDPARRHVTWVDDPSKPLLWAAAATPSQRWSLSALRNQIFNEADLGEARSSAADMWTFDNQTIYWIAENSIDSAS